MENVKFGKTDYGFFFLVWVAFYLLNRFSPFTGDDYWYRFIYDSALDGFRPVSSLQDAVHSQLVAYVERNGRFVVHTLTAYFCGVLGVEVFRICNSVVFVLLIAGIVRLLRMEFGAHKSDKYLILLLVFLLMPYPGQILLGTIAMCINYLWTACAVVYMLILYRESAVGKKKDRLIRKIGICVLAFMVGSLQESFSIGISLALLVYYCFHFSRFSGTVRWITIGFWLGTAIVTLAPGNFVRLGQVNSAGLLSGVMKYVSYFFYLFFQSKLLILFLFISFILIWRKKVFYWQFCQKNSIYLIAVLFNILVASVVYSGERQLTCIELFSLILIIKLMYSLPASFWNAKREGLTILASCVILCLVYIPVYQYRSYADEAYKRLNSCRISDSVAENCDFVESMRRLKSTFLSRRYTYDLEFENWVYGGYSVYRTNGRDSNSVSALLPVSVSDALKAYDKFSQDGIYCDEKNQYYLFRTAEESPVQSCSILSESLSVFGKMRNWIFGKEQTIQIDVTDKLGSFTRNGYIYYVLYQSDYKILGISIR